MSTIALTLAPPRSRARARVAFQVGCALAGSALIAGLLPMAWRLLDRLRPDAEDLDHPH